MNNIFKNFIFIFFTILFIYSNAKSEVEKIKIGVLVPMTGANKEIGQLILKSTRMALEDIGTNIIEIYPKDTASDPNQTLMSAREFSKMGINIVIGPVFHKNLLYLDELENIKFLSLTNKIANLPKNVVSSGINATSQLNAIKKFIKSNGLKKSIFLMPQENYEEEVKKAIKQSNIKLSKIHLYNIEPTKLTKQIEKITNYKIRKQNLADEIKRVENSDLPDKEKQIEKLNKRYTIGNLKFDSIIISDFDESLKSVMTSLLYTDVSPKSKYIITFNQWFDESLINEKTLQPIYYPSINKKNLDNFNKKFFKKFKEQPNHLTLLSYDLIGLIYYLSLETNITELDKLFKKKNSFKGKIGIFEIQNNKINHRLNFYQVNDGKIKKIF
jgi:ABC-type branched-subunit amino acid transport system substrate-binding protein|tara:strand:+ start:10 stop:1164 length:1155 start_codon:yes stop_codon:yes gene_type:complete